VQFVESAEMYAYSFRGRKFEAVGVGPDREMQNITRSEFTHIQLKCVK